MNGCVYRTEDNKCKFWSDYGKGIVSYCDPCDCEEKTASNADRIRSMSDEELAEWTTTVGRTFGEEYEGYMSVLDWLKSPVEAQDGT